MSPSKNAQIERNKTTGKPVLSRRQQERKRRHQIKTRNNILTYGGIFLFALIMVLVLYLALPNSSASLNVQAVEVSDIEPPFMADKNSAGDPAAPIRIEAFSDFNCSHCKEFNDDLEKQIFDDYVSTGKVYFTYISFPILAASSSTSAQAAYCAADQGKFWEYKDTLYMNVGKTPNPFSTANLQNYATKLGLNVADWRECFDNNKYTQQLQSDLEYGKSIGVEGTPSFNVNGTIVYRTTLLTTIEQLLASLEQ
ncbi:MAG: thioredoxin domain-containing protein [Anaerolineae bacterium]|nr:thioredoxin domain-containing protein [Anaerolineae bacterium]